VILPEENKEKIMNELKLYVLGQTPELEKDIENLNYLLKEVCEGKYSLTVVDLLETPQLAEDDSIFATPTLIKILPHPAKKIIGDFNDRNKLVVGLNLTTTENE